LFILKTSTDAKPTWLDLPHGVRVQVPPLNVAVLRAAEYRAMKAFSAGKEALDLPDGVEIEDEPAGDLEGTFVQARIRALAGKIMAWEGVVDEDGEPVPITPEALDAFAAHPAVGPAFARAYESDALKLVAEKNGSAPSGSGGPAEESNTAAPAPAAVLAAPAS
jgi:hypothetical protein